MLRDKVCVVTGAGRGIGRATAVEMARRGACVVASDVRREDADETAELVKDAGGRALAVACDVTDASAVTELMDAAAATFGRLDVVSANAGVHDTGLTQDASFDGLDEAVFDRVYAVNVKGVFLTIKHAVPHLRAAGGGAIVLAGSVSSFVAFPHAVAYTASKGAVTQLAKAAAVELAPDNIRVNCYCPASIDTPMVSEYLANAPDREAAEREITGTHLVPRLGRAEEVANLVCFLASDEASFLTGASYLVDGGALAWRGVRA